MLKCIGSRSDNWICELNFGVFKCAPLAPWVIQCAALDRTHPFCAAWLIGWWCKWQGGLTLTSALWGAKKRNLFFWLKQPSIYDHHCPKNINLNQKDHTCSRVHIVILWRVLMSQNGLIHKVDICECGWRRQAQNRSLWQWFQFLGCQVNWISKFHSNNGILWVSTPAASTSNMVNFCVHFVIISLELWQNSQASQFFVLWRMAAAIRHKIWLGCRALNPRWLADTKVIILRGFAVTTRHKIHFGELPLGTKSFWGNYHSAQNPFGGATTRHKIHLGELPLGTKSIWGSYHSAQNPFGGATTRHKKLSWGTVATVFCQVGFALHTSCRPRNGRAEVKMVLLKLKLRKLNKLYQPFQLIPTDYRIWKSWMSGCTSAASCNEYQFDMLATLPVLWLVMWISNSGMKSFINMAPWTSIWTRCWRQRPATNDVLLLCLQTRLGSQDKRLKFYRFVEENYPPMDGVSRT